MALTVRPSCVVTSPLRISASELLKNRVLGSRVDINGVCHIGRRSLPYYASNGGLGDLVGTSSVSNLRLIRPKKNVATPKSTRAMKDKQGNAGDDFNFCLEFVREFASCRELDRIQQHPKEAELCKEAGRNSAIFLKHNVEQSEVAEGLQIRGVPFFHFGKNGTLVAREKCTIQEAVSRFSSFIQNGVVPTTAQAVIRFIFSGVSFGKRAQEPASTSGRRAFSSMYFWGLFAFTFVRETDEVLAEETAAKDKIKKGRPPSSPFDQDRLLEQNRRMQKLNNAPSEFPGFIRDGYNVKVITGDKYVTSKSGLMYYDMVVGQGDLPQDGQQVIFHYTGYNESGRRVDSSYQQGRPARTRLGINGMIPGFEEGIKSMRAGGRRIMIVPPELGPPVGPSTFFSAKQFEVFDVELLEAKDCSRRTVLFYSDVVCD